MGGLSPFGGISFLSLVRNTVFVATGRKILVATIEWWIIAEIDLGLWAFTYACMSSRSQAPNCCFCSKKSILLLKTVALRCKSQNLSMYFWMDSPSSSLKLLHAVKTSSLAPFGRNYFMMADLHSFQVLGASSWALKVAHQCLADFWKYIATWQSLEPFVKCSPPKSASNCWIKWSTLFVSPYVPSKLRKVMFFPPPLNFWRWRVLFQKAGCTHLCPLPLLGGGEELASCVLAS